VKTKPEKTRKCKTTGIKKEASRQRQPLNLIVFFVVGRARFERATIALKVRF